MPHDSPGDLTRLLAQIDGGDRQRTDELLAIVYDDLRQLAAQKLANEPGNITFQATALVHEAYVRLVGDREYDWDSAGHFFAAAAEAMRRILVERARRYRRKKHGGDRRRTAFTTTRLGEGTGNGELLDVLSLHEALTRLEKVDQRMNEIVKLRYFAGLTVEETGRALRVSGRTVDRDWVRAKAWLHREITRIEAEELLDA